MKIFISEIDRQNARSVALKNLARFFGIPSWEFKSNDELYRELEKIDNADARAIIPLVKYYFTAYDDWFTFYQSIREIEAQQKKEHELDDSEKQQLQKLILRRQNSLEALQNEFDKLQIKRFNKNQFGTDIGGIIK